MTANPPTNAPPPISDVARLMQYDAAKKSTGVAYLLWFFLGSLGIHRFYLGRTGSGVAMLILGALSWLGTFVLIGYLGLGILGIWWLFDAFLIPGIAARENMDLANRLGGVR